MSQRGPELGVFEDVLDLGAVSVTVLVRRRRIPSGRVLRPAVRREPAVRGGGRDPHGARTVPARRPGAPRARGATAAWREPEGRRCRASGPRPARCRSRLSRPRAGPEPLPWSRRGPPRACASVDPTSVVSTSIVACAGATVSSAAQRFGGDVVDPRPSCPRRCPDPQLAAMCPRQRCLVERPAPAAGTKCATPVRSGRAIPGSARVSERTEHAGCHRFLGAMNVQ